MAAAASAPTPSEYIVHHLAHLNSTGSAQKSIVDFTVINFDTVFYSVLTAAIAGLLMYLAARRVHAGVPDRFLGAIESDHFRIEVPFSLPPNAAAGEERRISGLVLWGDSLLDPSLEVGEKIPSSSSSSASASPPVGGSGSP